MQSQLNYLDVREPHEFTTAHLECSCNIRIADIEERMNELPPKGSELILIASTNESADIAEKILKEHDYTVSEKISLESSTLQQIADQHKQTIKSGPNYTRLWKPSPFLEEALPEIEKSLASQELTALDLACGSCRDAVYLAMRNWKVIGVDYTQAYLDKGVSMAKRYNTSISTLNLDLEDKPEDELYTMLIDGLKSLQVENSQGFALVHVARYLHRPLFPLIKKLIRPGGFIVYHTFMKGCFKPRRPRFILEPEELKQIFADFKIIEYREAKIEDGRPVQLIIAQK